MTERHYVIRRSGNGWIYSVGAYSSSLFGSAALAAEIARAAADRAHRRGDDTHVEVELGSERQTLWRRAPHGAVSGSPRGAGGMSVETGTGRS